MRKEEIDPAIIAEQEEECRKRKAAKDRLHRNCKIRLPTKNSSSL